MVNSLTVERRSINQTVEAILLHKKIKKYFITKTPAIQRENAEIAAFAYSKSNAFLNIVLKCYIALSFVYRIRIACFAPVDVYMFS